MAEQGFSRGPDDLLRRHAVAKRLAQASHGGRRMGGRRAAMGSPAGNVDLGVEGIPVPAVEAAADGGTLRCWGCCSSGGGAWGWGRCMRRVQGFTWRQ